MSQCPECHASIEVDEFDVDVGDLVTCPSCGSCLEVTSVGSSERIGDVSGSVCSHCGAALDLDGDSAAIGEVSECSQCGERTEIVEADDDDGDDYFGN